MASWYLGAERHKSVVARNNVILRTVAVSIVCNITNQNYHKFKIMVRTEKKQACMKEMKAVEEELKNLQNCSELFHFHLSI